MTTTISAPFSRISGTYFRSGFRNVIDGNFACAQIRFIPNHDLRRNKADIADFQSLRVAVFINNAVIL